MKKFLFATLTSIAVVMGASAQSHTDSRYYNPQTGRMEYSRGPVREPRPAIVSSPTRPYGNYDHNRPYAFPDTYVGLRIGPAFTHVTSDDPALDGGSWKTGLNVGVAVGKALSYHAPVYLETGLYYTEKGGKGPHSSNKEFTYSLDYLELPLLLKYKVPVDREFSLEPYFGGYFAVGVGGKIKDYANREAYSSFSSNAYDNGTFRRCDAGLKFGIGAAYKLSPHPMAAEIYMELGYDLGLANVCHDTFSQAKNGALTLNFGINM